MSKDYSETLNLPKTDFPMRANLPQNEPKLIKYWDDIKLYKLLQSKSGESSVIFDLATPIG